MSQVQFHSIRRELPWRRGEGFRSVLPLRRLEHVAVSVAFMGIGRMPIVGEQRWMTGPTVVHEALVYPWYVGLLLGS